MNNKTNHGWLWLGLIAGGFAALALAATFVPEILDQRIAEGPATWALLASAGYLGFVIGVMGLAIRPFARSDDKADR